MGTYCKRAVCFLMAAVCLLGLTGCQPVPEAAPSPSPTAAPTATPTPEPTPEPTPTPTPLPPLDDEAIRDKYESLHYAGVYNILLVGVDVRSQGSQSFNGLADTIIILTIDARNKKLKMTSVMRDTCMPFGENDEGEMTYNRINHGIIGGGPEQLCAILQESLGIPIQHYAVVNVVGLVRIIDYLGGMTISVSESEVGPMNDVIAGTFKQWPTLQEDCIYIEAPGTYHLNGVQVQAYARMRKGTAGSDTARTRRQREVILKLARKIGIRAIFNSSSLVENLMRYVKTNITLEDAAMYAGVILRNNIALDPENLQFPFPGWYTSGKRGSKFSYMLLTDLEASGEALYQWLYMDVPPAEALDEAQLQAAYDAIVNPPQEPEKWPSHHLVGDEHLLK